MKSATDGTVVQMRDFRANEVGKQVGEALSSVTQALSSVSDTFFDEWEKMATRAKQAASATDDFVHDHPWAATGVAVAVGIAIGFFVARAGGRQSEAAPSADVRAFSDG